MRILVMTGLLVSAAPPAVAAAEPQQRGVRSMPRASMMHRQGMRPNLPRQHVRMGASKARWGHRFNGRWYGGYRAPGGWGAYRRPIRGFVLPRYWIAPSFYIADFAGYGLSAPQAGYGWYRYYDDAVLADGRGNVRDSVSGVEWDRGSNAYEDYPGDYREEYYADGPDEGDRYADEVYRAERRDNNVDRGERRDSGVGGAVIGGVAGAVAGGAIAGRGNRVGGALIGGGVGAIAGAAIDQAEDRGRRGPPPPPRHGPAHGADYAGPPPHGPGHRGPPPPVRYGPRGEVVQPLPGEMADSGYAEEYADEAYDDREVVTTTTRDGGARYAHGGHYVGGGHSNGGHTVVTSGGYVAGGWYYPPVTTTTISYSQPVTTTTIVEEYVSYRPAVRTKKVYRSAKRKWRPRAKAKCVC